MRSAFQIFQKENYRTVGHLDTGTVYFADEAGLLESAALLVASGVALPACLAAAAARRLAAKIWYCRLAIILA